MTALIYKRSQRYTMGCCKGKYFQRCKLMYRRGLSNKTRGKQFLEKSTENGTQFLENAKQFLEDSTENGTQFLENAKQFLKSVK